VIFLLIIAAAVALLLWPEAPAAVKSSTAAPSLPSVPVPAIPQPPKAPSYRSAIESLASVRSRLIATETLDDKAKEAINELTLCLVAGSDKE
jgi:hypothetical protein